MTARVSLLPSIDETDRKLQQQLNDEQEAAREAFDDARATLDAALQQAVAHDTARDEKGGA